jgi:transposase
VVEVSVPDKSDKPTILREHAALNPRPQAVVHALFQGGAFFDPRDLLQVKYEMLRLVLVDKRPISEAAKACGLSRPSFYQAQTAFEQGGLAGLLRHKPGPHGAHKLTPQVLEFVAEARSANPQLRAAQLASSVRQRFGLQVHPRSIDRQLASKKKRR